MEGGVATKGGQEEIKMLVGETPNATSGNPQTLVCPRQIPQPQNEVNSSASTLYACVHEFPRVANQGGRMASYSSSNFACNPAAGKHQGSGDDYVSVERRPVNPDELNLPDDQSLTSALENLSIDHGVSGEPTRQSSVRYNIAPHVHGLRLYGQHNAPANKFSPVDSADMSVLQAPTPLDALNIANQTLQTYAPLTISEINKFNIRANCQMDSHELEGQKPETLPGGFRDLQHRAPVYTGDTSFISGMNNPQFLFSKSFQAVDFRSPTFQKHYCSDRYPTYNQAQDLTRPHVAWDDRCLTMHQKQFHLQQLRNQEIYQLQNCNNSVVQPLTCKSMPSFFGLPISHQIEQPNQDDYFRGNALGWSENQQGLALMGSGSCKYYVPGYCGKENFTFPHARKQTSGSGIKYSGRDFRPVPALNRVGKQASPEKILTRSKGSRSLRIPDASLLPSNDLVNHAGFKQMVPPNSQFYPVVQTSASFQVDDGDTKGISDNSYYRLMTGSPQPDYNYDSLDDAVGRIYSLSKDQTGCRFLQETLKNCTSQDVYKIFIEITSHIVDLTTDPFGNYLLQKLVEVCNEDQKMCIIREITSKPGELIRISCDMHGTRVVQKVIEALKTTEQVSMVVSSLKPGVMPLIKDTNGNHVIQHCLKHLSPEFTKFLLDAAIPHSVELAKDRQGCVVLQKCLYHLDGQQRERIISDISSNALVLSQHQFGNYVVQYLLELSVPSAMEVVLDKLEGNFAYLSVQKYSSNVVEKCLKYSGEDHHCRIISELINNPRLVQILQDPYGNYVIQSAIKSCKGALYDALVDAIRPHIPAIQSNPYGKKVLSTLSRKK